MEIANRRWNGHGDDEITIQENGRFGRAEEALVWLSIVRSLQLLLSDESISIG
jgi:hypothetical protein